MAMTKDEVVKQIIVKQAQALFQRYGLKKTTMDEIAHSCGKAKSTLYYYFKNKDEVFEEVLVMEVQHLRNIVTAQVDKEVTVKKKLGIYFITFHQELVKKVNLYRLVKGEFLNDPFISLGQTKKNSIVNFKQFIHSEKDYITTLMEDGYKRNENIKIDPSKFSWFAETIIAAFFGIMGYTADEDLNKNQEGMEKRVYFFLNLMFD